MIAYSRASEAEVALPVHMCRIGSIDFLARTHTHTRTYIHFHSPGLSEEFCVTDQIPSVLIGLVCMCLVYVMRMCVCIYI